MKQDETETEKPSPIYSLDEEQRRMWELFIPSDMQGCPQWGPWRYEYCSAQDKPGRWTKVLYNVRTGKRANPTDPSTCVTFEEAMDACYSTKSQYDGIGFMLTAKDEFVAIDLDHCCNRDTVQIDPWATNIVNRLGGYAEISPSGTGIRIMLRGSLPPVGRRKGNIEVYDNLRYVTLTGRCLLDADGDTVPDRNSILQEWHAEVFAPAPTSAPQAAPSAVPSLSDERVLQLAFKAKNGAKTRSLYDGNSSAYGNDESSADLALIKLLAFYTQDEFQLDRLFRGSKLMRKKWDERRGAVTYGQRTIHKAMESGGERYEARHPKSAADHTFDQTGDIGAGTEHSAPDSPTPTSITEPTSVTDTHSSGEPSLPDYRLLKQMSYLDTLPPLEWLIPEWVPYNSFCAIVGDYGRGKTFVMLDMAFCIACGIPFHGRAVKQGSVIVIEAEGVGSLLNRKAAWLASHPEADPQMLEDNCYLIPKAVQMWDQSEVQELLDDISLMPTLPVLVVIDTLARANQGKDENGVHDMSEFIGGCDRIRNATGGSVMVLHHPNKDGGIRGSSALPGALDTIILCKMDKRTRTITLHCDKQKHQHDEIKKLHFTLMKDDPSGGAYLVAAEGTGVTDAECSPLDAEDQKIIDGIKKRDAWLPNRDIRNMVPDIAARSLSRKLTKLVELGELEMKGKGCQTRYRTPTDNRLELD